MRLFVSIVGVLIAIGLTGENPQLVPKGLQPFEPLIGEWRANGFLESDKLQGWDEPTAWGWRFERGQIVGMEATFKGGRYFVAATLDTTEVDGQYRFVATTSDGKKAVYQGVLKGKRLVLARESNDVPTPDQVTIELLHDVRYQMLMETRKTTNSFKKIATIGATPAEVRFGAAGKEEQGPKCIITGAPGTSTVTYKNQNYFVCCSGCRSEFEHDPEKWLKLAKEAKLKKGGSEAPVTSSLPPDGASLKDRPKTPTNSSASKDEAKKSTGQAESKEKSESDSKSASALLSRAKLLEKNGKREAARQNYERLLKEFPKSKEAKEAESRLKDLAKEAESK